MKTEPVVKKIAHKDKATYLAYALGGAMFKSLEIAFHELSISPDPVDRKFVKLHTKDRVKLHQAYHKMFEGAKKYLSKEEIEKMETAILELVGGLWPD